MNVIVLGAAIGIVTLLFGFLLMVLFTRFSVAVEKNAITIETEDRARKSVNPQATAGFMINAQGSSEEQLEQARLLAAKQAAALPRGGNVGIGRLDTTDARLNKKTASKGVDGDPVTAVKIAQYHSWQGLQIDRTQLAAPTAAAAAGSTKMVKRKLEPGTDYPVVAITDSMSPPEKRAARVANAKAKSAAYKALKESGQMMVAETVVAPAATTVAAAIPAAAAAIPEPDYIEISDDMSADDKRKARIANSKAKSAYNKALKAAGVDPSAVTATDVPSVAAAAPAAVQAEASSTDLSGIPKPDLIEITDDMAPEDVRAARIANSKATSAYKKALKAAGIDPSSVSI